MNGADLKTFTEQLIGGESLNETFFYNMLNSVKDRIEGARDWSILLKMDSSQQALTGDDHTTSKDLPNDFSHLVRRTERQPQLVLYQNPNNTLEYKTTALSNRFKKQDQTGLFVVDNANDKFYLLGGELDGTYTIHLYYISDSSDITSSTEWVFPRFHTILAYEVAYLYTGGVDYDSVNRAKAPVLSEQGELIYRQMKLWDSRLQLNNIQDQ